MNRSTLCALRDVFEQHLVWHVSLSDIARMRAVCSSWCSVGHSVVIFKREQRLQQLLEVPTELCSEAAVISYCGLSSADDGDDTVVHDSLHSAIFNAFLPGSLRVTDNCYYHPFYELLTHAINNNNKSSVAIVCAHCSGSRNNVFVMPLLCCWACAITQKPMQLLKLLLHIKHARTSHFSFSFGHSRDNDELHYHLMHFFDCHSSNGGLEEGVYLTTNVSSFYEL